MLFSYNLGNVSGVNTDKLHIIEDLPTTLGEEEKEIQACIINEDLSPNCIVNMTVKIRICDNRIQYYLPYLTWSYPWTPYCFGK